MALRRGFFRRMFSGFRSQCIISTSDRLRNSSDFNRCRENFRIKLRETPRNLKTKKQHVRTVGARRKSQKHSKLVNRTYFVFLSNSYRLNDRISKTRHWWLRYMKWSSSRTMLLSSLSSLSLILFKMSISVLAWIKNGFRDLMILIATSAFLSWS